MPGAVLLCPELSYYAQNCVIMPRAVLFCPELCYYARSCVILPGAVFLCPELCYYARSYVSLPVAMFFSLSCVVLPRAVLLYFVWSRHFEAAPVSTFEHKYEFILYNNKKCYSETVYKQIDELITKNI